MMWTADMDKELAAGIEAGLSASLIAKQMGISRNAVVGKCFRLKVNGGEKRVPTATAKMGPGPAWVKLNREIFCLVADYAKAEGVKVDIAANELLRQVLGAAA